MYFLIGCGHVYGSLPTGTFQHHCSQRDVRLSFNLTVTLANVQEKNTGR